MTGLLGGAFDPPHAGHVALAEAALGALGLDRLVVLVASKPGHKPVETDIDDRLALARLAFGHLPRTEVVRDDHAYTVDLLRTGEHDDAVFVLGADQFAGFLRWKEPDEVLERVRLAVATRPGVPQTEVDAVLGALPRPDRVEFFEIPAVSVSSRETRARVREGRPIEGLVPEAVAREIDRRGLYR
jgi:nicotinate-nucleotide adenylyltransferase